MVSQPHEDHISRHLRQVGSSSLTSGDQLRQILNRSNLDVEGSRVRKRGSGELTDYDCLRYRDAIREILGVTALMLVTANFMLAGCTCAKAA